MFSCSWKYYEVEVKFMQVKNVFNDISTKELLLVNQVYEPMRNPINEESDVNIITFLSLILIRLFQIKTVGYIND